MSPEVISMVALVIMFVIATILPVNMGALAFVAAFFVGTLIVGLSPEQVLLGFPANLFLVLVGVTYLFAIAHSNGTVDVLIRVAVRLVGGRVAAIPWVMFFVTALLTAVGALSPAAVAIVAPIALGFAAKYQINTLMMGAMVVHGAQGGGVSPISVYGGIIQAIVAPTGLPSDPITLFVLSFVFNFAFALAIFVALGGRGLLGRRVQDGIEEPALVGPGHSAARPLGAGSPRTRLGDAAGSNLAPVVEFAQIVTIAGLLALIVLTVGFRLNLGFAAITIAVALALLFPSGQKDAVAKISWPTVLLLGGVLTYVSVLERAGTITYVGDGVLNIGMPLLAALVLCYIAGLVTAFASTTAMLGVVIPLSVPFLMTGEVGAVAMVAAVAISALITDISPFSTNGALVLANAKDPNPDRLYRHQLIYTALLIVVSPLATWALLIAPGWL